MTTNAMLSISSSLSSFKTASIVVPIWSTDGLANTSPHAAADKNPGPVNPDMAGSWPLPPPETTATLCLLRKLCRRPSFFNGVETTTFFSNRFCARCGLKDARPPRAEETTEGTSEDATNVRGTVSSISPREDMILSFFLSFGFRVSFFGVNEKFCEVIGKCRE